MTAKAYSYLRFSTPEQRFGDSERRQTDAAERYARENGLTLDDRLRYRDDGKSAYTGRNVASGQLGAFLRAIEEGIVEPGSYLLVESLDRLSRQSPWDALPTLQQIVNAGVTVVTLQPLKVLDRKTLSEEPFAFISVILDQERAHQESALKARRLQSAWENKRANASKQPVTARCPAWLMLNRKGRKFEVIPKRAKVVRRIFKMALEGVGQHKIAETLNREEVSTFGKAKLWQRSYVLKILTNPAVFGQFVPHIVEHVNGRRVRKPQERIDRYFPAVVTKQAYRSVQALRSVRTPLRGRHAEGEVRNLFGGLARCPQCAQTMTRVYKGKNNGSARLVCTTAKQGGNCKYKTVAYDQIEAAFLRDAQRVIATVPAGTAGEEIDRELSEVMAGLDVLEAEITRLAKAVRRGDSRRLVTELREAENECETLKQQKDRLSARWEQIAGSWLEHNLADLGKALSEPTLDRARVNSLLRQLCDSAVVDYENGLLCLHWKQGGQSQVVFAMPEEVHSGKRRSKKVGRSTRARP